MRDNDGVLVLLVGSAVGIKPGDFGSRRGDFGSLAALKKLDFGSVVGLNSGDLGDFGPEEGSVWVLVRLRFFCLRISLMLRAIWALSLMQGGSSTKSHSSVSVSLRPSTCKSSSTCSCRATRSKSVEWKITIRADSNRKIGSGQPSVRIRFKNVRTDYGNQLLMFFFSKWHLKLSQKLIRC